MTWLQILLIALVLDYFIGDPDSIWRKFPHPAVLMGQIVSWFDNFLNNGGAKRVKGILAIILMVIIALLVGYVIRWIPDFGILELILVAILFAHNSLVKHVKAVADALRVSLADGRVSVSRIVGRDVDQMDASDVSRAAVESAAENFSDAVVAPAFWYLILGLPGLVAYKMINTADSMIGHKSERYREFGFGAAKLDDIVNWIPARICGALICAVYRSQEAFDIMRTDADLHESVNAGWPEAAVAGVLDIALSGPRTYSGVASAETYINPRGRRDLNVEDIEDSLTVIGRAWLGLVGFIGVLVFLAWLL